MPQDDVPDRTPVEIESDIRRLEEMKQDANPETGKRIDREIDELQGEKDRIERGRGE